MKLILACVHLPRGGDLSVVGVLFVGDIFDLVFARPHRDDSNKVLLWVLNVGAV